MPAALGAQDMLEESWRLGREGKYAEAKAGLVVAICLFPADAAVRFEHWRICCISGELQASMRILKAVSDRKELTERFCELLLAELRRSHAEVGGEVTSVARPGCLKGSFAVLSCCLALIPESSGSGYEANEIWDILMHLAAMSSDTVSVWWRAAEYAYRLDSDMLGCIEGSSAGRKSKESSEGGGKGCSKNLCSRWSGLLATKCLLVILERQPGDEESVRQLQPEEVLRLRPLVERAVLHHFGAGQWRQMRALLESFVTVCPLVGLPDVGCRGVNAKGRSHGVAASVASVLGCETSSKKPAFPATIAAVGQVALLGCFLEGMHVYAKACCPQDTPGSIAEGPNDEEEEIVGAAGATEGAGTHGWFLIQMPHDCRAEKREPSSKRARVGAEGEKGVQAALAKQLGALGLLWRWLQHREISEMAGAVCKGDSLWADSNWVWQSCLADMHWHRGEYEEAAARLRRVEELGALGPVEHARCKLQLAVCERLAGKTDAKVCGETVQGLLLDVLAVGGTQLKWFVAGRSTVDAECGTPEHAQTTWGEIVVHCVMVLVHLGVVSAGATLVLSQVSWPRLGRFCLDSLRREGFSLDEVVDSSALNHLYNVDILEHLMAASAGKDKRLRQALETRMGTLGGDPPCPIAGVMREVLS